MPANQPTAMCVAPNQSGARVQLLSRTSCSQWSLLPLSLVATRCRPPLVAFFVWTQIRTYFEPPVQLRLLRAWQHRHEIRPNSNQTAPPELPKLLSTLQSWLQSVPKRASNLLPLCRSSGMLKVNRRIFQWTMRQTRRDTPTAGRCGRGEERSGAAGTVGGKHQQERKKGKRRPPSTKRKNVCARLSEVSLQQ
jgi:hypothetical protein